MNFIRKSSEINIYEKITNYNDVLCMYLIACSRVWSGIFIKYSLTFYYFPIYLTQLSDKMSSSIFAQY